MADRVMVLRAPCSRAATWIAYGAAVLATAAPLGAQQLRGGRLKAPEPVTAEVVGEAVKLDAHGEARFRVSVEVPRGHHGYLDKGDEGFFIPFAFGFGSLDEAPSRVTELSRPPGARDDEVKATVLRGKSIFEFALDTGGARPAPGTVATGSLRYQICNDTTGICYPPRTVEFPVRISG